MLGTAELTAEIKRNTVQYGRYSTTNKIYILYLNRATPTARYVGTAKLTACDTVGAAEVTSCYCMYIQCTLYM